MIIKARINADVKSPSYVTQLQLLDAGHIFHSALLHSHKPLEHTVLVKKHEDRLQHAVSDLFDADQLEATETIVETGHHYRCMAIGASMHSCIVRIGLKKLAVLYDNTFNC